jgi:hypothetical protein
VPAEVPHPPIDDERYWRTRPDHSLYLTRAGIALYREQIEAHESAPRFRPEPSLTPRVLACVIHHPPTPA